MAEKGAIKYVGMGMCEGGKGGKGGRGERGAIEVGGGRGGNEICEEGEGALNMKEWPEIHMHGGEGRGVLNMKEWPEIC